MPILPEMVSVSSASCGQSPKILMLSKMPQVIDSIFDQYHVRHEGEWHCCHIGPHGDFSVWSPFFSKSTFSVFQAHISVKLIYEPEILILILIHGLKSSKGFAFTFLGRDFAIYNTKNVINDTGWQHWSIWSPYLPILLQIGSPFYCASF